MNYLLLAVGGATGTILRYWVSLLIYSRLRIPAFPWATLFVNLSGSFLIGLLAAWNLKDILHPQAKLFLFVGLLGGFTTFSSYSLETIQLLRQSLYGLAIINIIASNAGGILLALAGFMLGKAFFVS